MQKSIWPTAELRLLEQGLDETIRLVNRLGRQDDEEAIAVASLFLVVRASGYLEQVLAVALRAHIMANAGVRVANFTVSGLARSANPNAEHLANMFKRLEPAWASEFNDLLDEDNRRIRDDLKFLLELRNKIAHGVSQTVGRRRAVELAKVSKELADWFIRRLSTAPLTTR